MKSIRYLFIIAFSFIILFSCNKTEKKVTGTWVIDKIIINGLNIKSNLSVNAIEFDSDKHCELPFINWKGSKQGKWEVKEDDDNIYLIISSQDSMLSGKYLLFFFRDPNKRLQKMIIMSSEKEIICSKFPD